MTLNNSKYLHTVYLLCVRKVLIPSSRNACEDCAKRCAILGLRAKVWIPTLRCAIIGLRKFLHCAEQLYTSCRIINGDRLYST